MSPPFEMKPSSPKGTTFSAFAKSIWRTWTEWHIGLATVLVFFLPALATIWNMHQQSRTILTASIKEDLISVAQVMATMVDPSVHATFQDRAQERSEAYQQQIARFTAMRPAVDPRGMIKFVYSCVQKGGKIFFVLDDTPDGDANGDGVDDKSHIMEQYSDASDALWRVFTTRTAQVSDAPYTDRWGTFISGYAPVFDGKHQVVAVVGADLAMKDYFLQVSYLKNVAVLSAIGALSLALLAGMLMARYHRRLMHSFAEQVKLGDAAMAASRAKSDFLAAMSHELRTPLNAIVGHGGLIAETATAAQRESVSEVRRAADSLLAMISDILDYASLDAGHMALHRKPARIALLVNEVHKLMVGDAAAKKLSFEVEVDPACPAWLMLDATLVKQVLRHLVINAIKFTSIGGVRLQVRLEKGNLLHFIVHDSGCGVSEENRARLFELFSMGDSSTTREHGGTGIGLAICKRLCDGMKGRIWLARTGAGGSEFHVELPTEVVPEPGKVWLVTKDSLTSILVSSVAMKQGRAIEVVDDVDRVAASDRDVVLVDAATVNAEGVEARCVVALNAEGVLTAPPTGFAEVLMAPLKPADVKRLLELTC